MLLARMDREDTVELHIDEPTFCLAAPLLFVKSRMLQTRQTLTSSTIHPTHSFSRSFLLPHIARANYSRRVSRADSNNAPAGQSKEFGYWLYNARATCQADIGSNNPQEMEETAIVEP